jgi:hypothetical protein
VYVLGAPDLRVARVEAPQYARPGETVFVKAEVVNQGADGYGWFDAYLDGQHVYRHMFGWFPSGSSATVVVSFVLGSRDATLDMYVGADTTVTHGVRVVVRSTEVLPPPTPAPAPEVRPTPPEVLPPPEAIIAPPPPPPTPPPPPPPPTEIVPPTARPAIRLETVVAAGVGATALAVVAAYLARRSRR